MLAWDQRVRGTTAVACLAVTDRSGGVSAPPYDELNLAAHVGDDPDAVAANRQRLAGVIGVPPHRLLFARQVHGADVAVVVEPWRGTPPAVDAMVTCTPMLALGVLVADCTPVLVTDAVHGVVGVGHAGRAGLAAGIVPALLDALRACGARAQTTVARVGPSICGRCYEVPVDMREQVASVVPESRTVSWTGTPALDIAAGVLAQLAPRCADVQWLPGCTRELPRFYSHRRATAESRAPADAGRQTGRFAGLAWLAT